MKLKKQLCLLILLVLVCLVLLLTGTYAAYTNTVYVKRVVTTGIDNNEAPFSSNYLYEISGSTYFRHIVTVSKNVSKQIYLTIYNYPQNDSTRVSSRDISYTLSIEVVGKDGSSTNLTPPTITPSAGTYQLPGNQISTDVFTITFTHEQVLALKDHFVRITAASTSGLSPEKKLAAEFQLISASELNTGWKGQFTDGESPAELDAFNYEVFGTAKGEITISWANSANYVTLSNWSREDLAPGSSGNSLSFRVGGEGQPTSYLLQFYRLRGRADGDDWPDIDVTFVPDSGSSTS